MEQEHKVIKAIEKANKHIRTYDRRLEFSIHDMTKQIIVRVINTEDDSVIREIPSEKVLDMVAHLWEISGILVDEHR
jgi:flagellar protein FlaG